MATETPGSATQPLPKTHDSQSAANLERVTDYAEEKEIVGDFGKAISAIAGQSTWQAKSKEKQDEMNRVVIRKEDVELIMREMEVCREVAERSLREHSGDVVKTLCTLTAYVQ